MFLVKIVKLQNDLINYQNELNLMTKSKGINHPDVIELSRKIEQIIEGFKKITN